MWAKGQIAFMRNDRCSAVREVKEAESTLADLELASIGSVRSLDRQKSTLAVLEMAKVGLVDSGKSTRFVLDSSKFWNLDIRCSCTTDSKKQWSGQLCKATAGVNWGFCKSVGGSRGRRWGRGRPVKTRWRRHCWKFSGRRSTLSPVNPFYLS